MANLKDIKTRITSVQKTKQITSAMKLVAAAKLRGATERAVQAQPYKDKLTDVLGRVSQQAGDASHPLLAAPEQVKTILGVVLTSDKGLCGGFNNTLLRRVEAWVAEQRTRGVEVRLRVFGRKGRDYLRSRGYAIEDSVVDYGKQNRMELVRPLTNLMVSGFTSGEYDEVHLVYNHFVNAITQRPTFASALPLRVDGGGESADSTEYLYEPSPAALLDTLLPLYLQTTVLQAFLETEAGEFAARMTAMDNATRNASDLIDRLSLEYNRARQAAITTEITEIVSGAEAL